MEALGDECCSRPFLLQPIATAALTGCLTFYVDSILSRAGRQDSRTAWLERWEVSTALKARIRKDEENLKIKKQGLRMFQNSK